MAGKGRPAADLGGQTFGQLTVIERAGLLEYGHTKRALWRCRCSCGTEKVFSTNMLTTGGARTCGCSHKKIGGYNRSHGMTNTKEFNAWRAMLKRCYQPSDISFANYGGRGITVCDRWRESFAAFYADMGDAPTEPKHSLDRINNDGNYEPGNCRWATYKEQAANRRPARQRTHL